MKGDNPSLTLAAGCTSGFVAVHDDRDFAVMEEPRPGRSPRNDTRDGDRGEAVGPRSDHVWLAFHEHDPCGAFGGRVRQQRSVARALAAEAPPRYVRAPAGSQLDPLMGVIGQVLEQWPDIKAPRLTELLRVEHGV